MLFASMPLGITWLNSNTVIVGRGFDSESTHEDYIEKYVYDNSNHSFSSNVLETNTRIGSGDKNRIARPLADSASNTVIYLKGYYKYYQENRFLAKR